MYADNDAGKGKPTVDMLAVLPPILYMDHAVT